MPILLASGGWNPTLLDLLNFMAVLVLSVAFHEMAHAWLANRFGDDTPREHGRMTLNPFAHVHPVLTILLPAYLYWTRGAFLFAAMTPVNPSRMRRPRLHSMLTSLGGPAASLLLGLVCLVCLVASVAWCVRGGREPTPFEQSGMAYIAMAVHLNVFGAFFNLVPVPPLDGSSLLEYVMPGRWIPAWRKLQSWSWILLAVLMLSGILGRLLAPVSEATEGLVDLGIAWGARIGRG
jgi:Zn-dependent protease